MGRGKHIKKPKKIQKKVEPKIEPDIAPVSENEGELGLPKASAEAPKMSKKDKRATRENVLKMLQKLQNDSSSTESEKPAREVFIIDKKLR